MPVAQASGGTVVNHNSGWCASLSCTNINHLGFTGSELLHDPTKQTIHVNDEQNGAKGSTL